MPMRTARSSIRPRMRLEEFRLLRDLVNHHAGLYFQDDALYMFDRRLSRRITALQLSGYGEYYRYLSLGRQGWGELDQAIELLTIGETYFFREDYQLRGLTQELLPRLAVRNGRQRRLNLWSAGCATGEEAYTLAMIIHGNPLFAGWHVRVVGSDICKSNVSAARRGVYREPSFRVMPAGLRERYFKRQADGWHVDDELKRMCHFGQLNLLDADRAAIVGRVDVVLCRNVLIYFDAQSRRRVIDNLYTRLVPGGYLLLGHSESLLNVSTAFELVHLKEDLVYSKPEISDRWDWDEGQNP